MLWACVFVACVCLSSFFLGFALLFFVCSSFVLLFFGVLVFCFACFAVFWSWLFVLVLGCLVVFSFFSRFFPVCCFWCGWGFLFAAVLSSFGATGFGFLGWIFCFSCFYRCVSFFCCIVWVFLVLSWVYVLARFLVVVCWSFFFALVVFLLSGLVYSSGFVGLSEFRWFSRGLVCFFVVCFYYLCFGLRLLFLGFALLRVLFVVLMLLLGCFLCCGVPFFCFLLFVCFFWVRFGYFVLVRGGLFVCRVCLVCSGFFEWVRFRSFAFWFVSWVFCVLGAAVFFGFLGLFCRCVVVGVVGSVPAILCFLLAALFVSVWRFAVVWAAVFFALWLVLFFFLIFLSCFLDFGFGSFVGWSFFAACFFYCLFDVFSVFISFFFCFACL